MKNNLKTKVMLAVLAGGMLCANGAWAEESGNIWFGAGNNATTWLGTATDDFTGACTTGANLTLNGTEGSFGGISFAEVDSFYGGYSNAGGVSGNTVTINGGDFTFSGNTSDVFPAMPPSIAAGMVEESNILSNVSGNTLKINGGSFEGEGVIAAGVRYGETAPSGEVVGGTSLETGNKLLIYNITLKDEADFELSGGYANFENKAVPVNYNSVEVKKIEMGEGTEIDVYGGHGAGPKGASVSYNLLDVQGFILGKGISFYGGYGYSSSTKTQTDPINTTVEGNEVNVVDVNVMNLYVVGGEGLASVEPDDGLDAVNVTMDIKDNEVYISGVTTAKAAILGGSASSDNDSDTFGGNLEFTVSGNTVKILDSTIEGQVETYGGSADFSFSGFGEDGTVNISITNNSMEIENSNISGEVMIAGGYADEGDATGNTITITDSNVSGEVIVAGGHIDEGDATGNTITITDSSVSGEQVIVAGGYIDEGDATGNTITITDSSFLGEQVIVACGYIYGEGDAKDNIVTITNSNFGDGFYLCGGFTQDGESTGNTLNLKSVIGGKAAMVAFFQKMNFTVPADMDKEMAMLNVSSAVVLNGVEVNILNGPTLADGDYITIIKNVDDDNFAPTDNLKILTIGSVSELVYTNGSTPVAKADFEITTNGKTSEVGDLYYYYDLGPATDDISNTNKTYGHYIQGNVDLDTGTLTDVYSGNKIIIRRGGYGNASMIYGAYNTTDSTPVSGNKVIVYDGVFEQGGIYGGYSDSGNVTQNSVDIKWLDNSTEGKISICGGYCYSDSGVVNATENVVNISGGSFGEESEIYGGYSCSEGGVATGNAVNISGGSFNSMIIGGCSDSGNATGNTVTISGGSFNSTISGGYSESGNATGNTVIINGGSFGNTCIYGGNRNSEENPANVTGNSVTITGGTFDSIVVCGGSNTKGNAGGNSDDLGNKVTITGGSFGDGCVFYGGSSDGEGAEAKNNILKISGGTFGEWCIFAAGSGESVIANTLEISGGTFADGCLLFGGQGFTSSDNNLNLKTKISGKMDVVGYFQTLNFTLPAGIQNGDKMLSTSALMVDGDGGSAKINVDAANGVKLKAGDVITLVDSDETMDNYIVGDILGGAAKLEYEKIVDTGTDLNGDTDTMDLVITLLKDFTAGGGAATTKAIAEGVAASLAFVNQGADMVAGSGIDGLYVADSENPTIAAFTGSKTRYNTGSHVDIHGWNALAGVALNNKESFSHGVFVEIGNGDIDTYAALNGSGSSDYKGGGYMLRKDMGKGWSMDGAVRAGRVETGWSNDTKGGYEAKQTYYGAHVTFNKMLKEYGEQKLNGYLRYTFTHLGSDSVNLDGTHYGFNSVNSHRTRLGARMVDEGQNGFELYYGAAWEYGFGGDCDANVNGVTTSGPAVDGSNAVFEVGTWSDNKWEINAGLEGYVGAKRGIAGGMNFIYKF